MIRCKGSDLAVGIQRSGDVVEKKQSDMLLVDMALCRLAGIHWAEAV
jgi:hypothetical protein